MAGFRSFSVAACQAAQAQGKTLYALDTGNAGEDDMLILAPDETLENLVAQILSHHELDQWPPHWSLDRVDWPL